MADTGGMKTLVTLILAVVLAATPTMAIAQPVDEGAGGDQATAIVAPDDTPTLSRSSWG
jgi:hypothetical protein